jgi:hypothetical protein
MLYSREQNWDETDTQIANFLYDQSTPVSYAIEKEKKSQYSLLD